MLHLGIGGFAVLAGLVLLVSSPLMGVFTVLIGLLLLALGHGLMNLRAPEWRTAIAVHAIDTLIGVLLGDGLVQISGPIISVSIILYLYSQRNLFRDG